MFIIIYEQWHDEYKWIDCKKIFLDKKRAIHFYDFLQKQNNIRRIKMIEGID